MVCANKIDLEPHISEMELIRELNLDYVFDNAWIVCKSALCVRRSHTWRLIFGLLFPVSPCCPGPISALHKTNIDQVLEWLIKQAK